MKMHNKKVYPFRLQRQKGNKDNRNGKCALFDCTIRRNESNPKRSILLSCFRRRERTSGNAVCQAHRGINSRRRFMPRKVLYKPQANDNREVNDNELRKFNSCIG